MVSVEGLCLLSLLTLMKASCVNNDPLNFVKVSEHLSFH